MEDLAQDIRYALRNLRRAPGFALVAILTLALGIGANTAIFSVVDAIIVRPLPYPQPEQLVGMRPMTLAEITRIAELNRSFTRVAAYMETSVGISGVGETERVDAAAATTSLFPTLGIAPAMGRWFNDDESMTGHSHVVMLSNALWQQRFGADRGAIGKSIMIEGAPYTIVGVMPADFRFPTKDTQLWTPVTTPLSRTSGAFWGSGGYRVVARLRPGVNATQAQQEVKALFGQIRLENPIWTPSAADYLSEKNTAVPPLQSKIVGSARTMLLLLLGVVSVVLLIACANVANLLLVRATSRQREMAIRAAIGGSRIRLVRQALTESVVLAAIGALCGILVAWGGVQALTAVLPADTPRVGEIALNARVLTFTAALALLTGLVFGIVPALRVSASNVSSAFGAGGRAGAAQSQRRLSRALVVAEIAAAVVLVTAATLLVRSVSALSHGDPGFRVESIVTARISPPSGAYKDTAVIARFYDDLLNRARAIPGVEQAAIVSEVPFTANYGSAYRIAGQFEDISGKTGFLPMSDHSLIVSPDYFTTIGIPLLAGRTFANTDRVGAPQVAIVSESFAKKFWPSSSALGQRIGYPWPSEWLTIVGVVRDAKLDSLTGTAEQTVYRPIAQAPRTAMSLVVRTRSDQLAIASALRDAVGQIDRTVPVSDVRTMAQVAASRQARPRFTMALLTIFAGIALILGVVGIYGLMSYNVAQRQREVGIRMALGATPGDAQRMVLGEGMKLAMVGIAIGLVAALSTTRLLSGFLYGVTSTDPLTFALATLTLAGVALAASYLPALRATKVDPTTALRAE